MNIEYIIILGLVIVFGLIMLGLCLDYYFGKIQDAKTFEETTEEPCTIKHPYGAIGETCKQFLLNKIDILEQRVEVLENEN